MSVSRKLREERKRLGLTQGELAEKLGVSQGTISRWESGSQSPDFESLIKLSQISDVDVVKLFLESDQEHPYDKHPGQEEVKIIGAVQEGVWLERPEWDEDEHFTVNLPPGLNNLANFLKGYLVRDNSGELVFTRDSLIFILPVDFRITILKQNDFLLVAARNDNSLVEVTIREIFEIGDGQFILETLSSDITFSERHKLVINSDGSASGEAPYGHPLTVLGLIVSSFRLEPALERANL